jgi:hypothetical protein
VSRGPGKRNSAKAEGGLTRHSRRGYTADTAQMSCFPLRPSRRRTRRGWAWCRRRGRSAGVSGARRVTRRPSVPGTDRRDIGGRLGRCGPCRIGCRSDIGSAGGRACGKTGANSARRWEGGPSVVRLRRRRRSGGITYELRNCGAPRISQAVRASTCPFEFRPPAFQP